jgi:ADP-heptose:LPS heptosyltransferase
MGLGGYILWTPVAREYYRAFGRKVYFTNRVFGRLPFPRRVERSPLFENNPHVSIKSAGGADELRLDNPEANYWTRVTRDRIDYKPGAHAVEIACAAYGIRDPEIRCELFLTEPELEKGRKVRADLGPFVAVEPHTKESFTVNKQWGFERWQEVADALRAAGLTLVQVGEGGKPLLEGVKDATGLPGIRETAAVLHHAELLVAPEGGLMHLANAVGTRSVIVYGGYVSPELTGYAENVNLFTELPCAPCGLRRSCLRGRRECLERIPPDEVCRSALALLEAAEQPESR